MPSYVITGVTRGLGWEFLNQLSNDPNNTVIGLVRRKEVTDKRVAEELSGRRNITILEADVTDYNALKKAAAQTAKITGGTLDYLIANAAFLSTWEAYDPIGTLAAKPEEFNEYFRTEMDTNVLANVHLYNLFLPLILKGGSKKVILISSGMGDLDSVNQWGIEGNAVYAASKAAMNMINAKFSTQYKKDGVLFLSICPGMVEVGHFKNATPKELEALQRMVAKFKEAAPHFEGPAKPEESIRDVLSVVNSCSVKAGHGGAYLSHLGNKQWL